MTRKNVNTFGQNKFEHLYIWVLDSWTEQIQIYLDRRNLDISIFGFWIFGENKCVRLDIWTFDIWTEKILIYSDGKNLGISIFGY